MDYQFKENGINMTFGVTDDGFVRLLNLSDREGKNEYLDLNKDCNFCCEHPPKESDIELDNLLAKTFAEAETSESFYGYHHGEKHVMTGDGCSLKFVGIRDERNEWGRIIKVISENETLLAENLYQFYDGIPVVRTSMKVRAKKDLTLEHLCSFQYVGLFAGYGRNVCRKVKIGIPFNTWHGEGQWRYFTPDDLGLNFAHGLSSGRRITYSNTGSWSSKEYLPQGMVFDGKTHYLWQIENNGSWYAEMGTMRGMLYLVLSGPTFTANKWSKKLCAGEEFESVPAAVAITENMEKSAAAMTEYRRRKLHKRFDYSYLFTQYNEYMHANWDYPDAHKLYPKIDAAAKFKPDYFVIDAGWHDDGKWFRYAGGWTQSEERYGKGGFEKLLAYIRKKGMKVGLWLEIETVGMYYSRLNEIDGLLMKRNGKYVCDNGKYFLDFSLEATRDYATKIVDRIYKEYGVDYLKIDYNVDSGAGSDNGDSLGDALLNHNRGFLNWLNDVQRKYPVKIEMCASGGQRLDGATLALSELQSTSDQIFYNKVPYILGNLMLTLVPEQAAAWCYPLEGQSREQVVMNLVNAMLFRMQLSGPIDKIGEETQELIREFLVTEKSLREFKKKAYPFLPYGTARFFEDTVAFGLKKDDKIILCLYNLNGKKEKIVPVEHILNAKVIFPKRHETEIVISHNALKVEFESAECARVLEIKINGRSIHG